LVLKKKTRRRRRRRRRRRQINESHCHYQLFFFEIFDSKNKLVNSTTIQIKSVSHKNVLFFYIFLRSFSLQPIQDFTSSCVLLHWYVNRSLIHSTRFISIDWVFFKSKTRWSKNCNNNHINML
jgi:hypothetical protein